MFISGATNFFLIVLVHSTTFMMLKQNAFMQTWMNVHCTETFVKMANASTLWAVFTVSVSRVTSITNFSTLATVNTIDSTSMAR